ncbi:MAG: hypothetical protein ACREO4_09200 [Lysobacter sp.]
MTEHSTREKLQIIRANILADAVRRAVAWLLFAAIVAGLVLPLAWHAFRAAGLVCGLAVLALCMALVWQLKPAGRSYGAQVREIGARYPRE